MVSSKDSIDLYTGLTSISDTMLCQRDIMHHTHSIQIEYDFKTVLEQWITLMEGEGLHRSAHPTFHCSCPQSRFLFCQIQSFEELESSVCFLSQSLEI